METRYSVFRDVAYLRRLAKAGYEGLASSWQDSQGVVFSPPLKRVAWIPMSAGAAVGLIAARYAPKRKTASSAAIGGAAGTVGGLVAAAAWASRNLVRAAARNALRRINATRDAHWLQLNPIDYA
jgi:hypothetical protein